LARTPLLLSPSRWRVGSPRHLRPPAGPQSPTSESDRAAPRACAVSSGPGPAPLGHPWSPIKPPPLVRPRVFGPYPHTPAPPPDLQTLA
jgi:hypothetical protein